MSEAPYPPAEPPADGDRTSQVPPPHGMAPRFSASASVPVPPAGPAAYDIPGSPFGQVNQYGQPGQAAFGQDPSLGQPPAGGSPTSGQARTAASASVPAPATQPNPPPYGSPPQGYSAQSGGTYGSPTAQQYGSPAGQGQFGSPPAGQGQFGQPPPGQGSFGSPPPYGQPPAGQGSAPGSSSPPAGSPGYAGGYDRQPQTGQQMGQGSYSAPVYGQPADQSRPREAGQAPAGNWAESDQEAPPRKSRRGLITAFIVVAILIVVGVGGFVGWSLTKGASDFTVGACVKQDGNDAVVTDCSGSGVYKIVSIVDAENGCPDANQPSLVLTDKVGGGKKWACLTPSS